MSGQGFTPAYGLLLAGLGLAGIDPAAPRTSVDTAFLEFLIDSFARLLPFDATFYLANNPDARDAVTHGEYGSAHEHFVQCGFRQGRPPQREPFDPAYYAGHHPDLAAIAQSGAAALAVHYLQHGRAEARAGHADTAAEAGRWRLAVARTSTPFANRSVSRAVVQAFGSPLLGPRGVGFQGGPMLGEGSADLLLRHRREWEAVDAFAAIEAAPAPLRGEYVYGGPYCAPFGHAMAETIHRVLPARTVFDCRRLLFVGSRTGAPPGGFAALPAAMQAALRFMEVAPRDVTLLNDDRIVDRLHLVQQGSVLGSGPSPAYLQLLADYTPARLDALHDGSGGTPRVYASRSRMPGGLILGERYLESLLVQDGFRILHPQDFALVAQMQAYRHADIIIFAEGSACHGVELFGGAGLRHCLLLPRRGHDHRHVFDHVLRPRAARYDVLPEAEMLGSIVADPRSLAPLAHSGVSVLDIEAVAAALRGLGVARLTGLSASAYRRAAMADFVGHLRHHRDAGTTLVDEAEIAALGARCSAALSRRRPARRPLSGAGSARRAG